MTKIYLIVIILIGFISCSKEQQTSEKRNSGNAPDTSVQKTYSNNTVSENTSDSITEHFNFDNFGNYVDGSYIDRSSGADWVGVKILPYGIGKAMVSIRSRADKMKPTCTFDGIASVISANELMSAEFMGTLIFKFSGKDLTISAGPDSQEPLLTYFCRGGGSLAGTYQKIDGELDPEQVDKTSYVKTLNMKGSDIQFYINVEGNKMTITPAGLKEDNKPVTQTIDGYVNDAEIADLNSDGSPEIYIYTVAEGTGRFGDVIGYSVNNGKSMSLISFHKIENNKEAYDGYGGKDEFAVVENTLVRRFPIFKPGDANSAPSGGTKQIQYKLKPGEAAWQLEIDKVIVF